MRKNGVFAVSICRVYTVCLYVKVSRKLSAQTFHSHLETAWVVERFRSASSVEFISLMLSQLELIAFVPRTEPRRT